MYWKADMEIISRSITRYLLRGDAVSAAVCRLCWTKTEGGSSLDRPLFIASQVFRGTLTVKEILAKLFQQRSYNEKNLPQTICDCCLETVLQFFQFWLLCQHTEHQLAAQTEWMTKQVTSVQKKVVERPNYQNLNSAVMFLKSKSIDLFHTEEEYKLRNVLTRLNVKTEESNEKAELQLSDFENNGNQEQQFNDFEEVNIIPEPQTNDFKSWDVKIEGTIKIPESHSNDFKCLNVKSEEAIKHLERPSNNLKCSVCKSSCIKSRGMCKACEIKLQLPKPTKTVNNSNKSHNNFGKSKEYICDHCQKKFGLKSNLRFHIRSIHLNPKSYECPDCHKKMNTKTQLEAHSTVHTKVRNFQCEICGKYFITKYALGYHIRLHTGEKPHKCNVCGEGFTNASRKAAHIRRRHLGRTETCNVCSKTYHSGYPFKRHMQRHFNPNSTLYQTNEDN